MSTNGLQPSGDGTPATSCPSSDARRPGHSGWHAHVTTSRRNDRHLKNIRPSHHEQSLSDVGVTNSSFTHRPSASNRNPFSTRRSAATTASRRMVATIG